MTASGKNAPDHLIRGVSQTREEVAGRVGLSPATYARHKRLLGLAEGAAPQQVTGVVSPFVQGDNVTLNNPRPGSAVLRQLRVQQVADELRRRGAADRRRRGGRVAEVDRDPTRVNAGLDRRPVGADRPVQDLPRQGGGVALEVPEQVVGVGGGVSDGVVIHNSIAPPAHLPVLRQLRRQQVPHPLTQQRHAITGDGVDPLVAVGEGHQRSDLFGGRRCSRSGPPNQRVHCQTWSRCFVGPSPWCQWGDSPH